jgi:hypothetical protein
MPNRSAPGRGRNAEVTSAWSGGYFEVDRSEIGER